MTFKFCPVCASNLVECLKFGAVRPCCSNSECGFVYFLDPKVVTVVLVEHEGRVLLGKRNINPGWGKWSFPGGYVNRGERVEEAAIREVKEETNLDIKLDSLLGVFSEEGNPVVLLVYQAQLVGEVSEMRPQEEEVMELGFFGLDEIPELAFQSEPRIIEELRQRKAPQ